MRPGPIIRSAQLVSSLCSAKEVRISVEEKEYLRHERIIDDIMERFVISLGEDNESELSVNDSEGSDADSNNESPMTMTIAHDHIKKIGNGNLIENMNELIANEYGNEWLT
ncbi:hypothetical protein J6590_055307, partial [Homalodisca vitripennis]